MLAVDAGSGGGRALVFDHRGALLSTAYREWTYDAPADAGPMGKEFAPDHFWGIICDAISDAISQSGVSPQEIEAVSAASQREGVVFLDADGCELYAGPNVDLRAIVEGLEIDARCGDEVYRITGHTPSLLFTPAKIEWFRRNRPDLHGRIDTALSVSDWIIYRLSGERVGEASCVSDLGLVDVSEVKWSRRLGEMVGLEEGVCPEIAAAGTPVGRITDKAASQTGLARDTLVVVGGADTQCGLLGMGVLGDGQVGIVAGWTGVLQLVTPEPIVDPKGRMWTSCHVLPGKWVLESNARVCGGAYRWLRSMLFGEGQDAADAYAQMDAMAGSVAPGAGGVVSYIGPMLMDMSSLKPSLGGFVLPITPSVTAVGREHLVRAAMENLCFAFKVNLLQLEEVWRLKLGDVSIGGGMAQSDCLLRMLSDVLAMPITAYPLPQVTALGVAMCGAVGAGMYSGFHEAMHGMRPAPRILQPSAGISEQYVPHYERWLSVSEWFEKLGDDPAWSQ